MCNLSIQGAYITLDEPLPEVGEAVQVAVGLPGQDAPLQAEAIIACQNREPAKGSDSLPPGIGLRFTALPPADQRRIESVIRQYHTGRSAFLLATPPHSGPRRVPFMRYGRLKTADRAAEALICNMSRLGAYVAVQPAPNVGDAVGLSFVSPEGITIAVEAVVTWRRSEDADDSVSAVPAGCGLRFVSLSKLDEVRIRAIVDAFPRLRRS
jgi:hypothetical protein